MTPIRQLLNRIRWDPVFAGASEFELGYLDKVAGGIVRVPLRRARMDPADHFSLQVMDADGRVHDVPYHRVRELYRDGQLVWKRP